MKNPQITQIDTDVLARSDRVGFHRRTHTPHPLFNAEAQRLREPSAKLHHAARSRPPNGGQGPLGREIAPNASVRRGVPAQRPALSERRPRHFSFSFHGWEKHASLHNLSIHPFASLRLCDSAALRSLLCAPLCLRASVVFLRLTANRLAPARPGTTATSR